MALPHTGRTALVKRGTSLQFSHLQNGASNLCSIYLTMLLQGSNRIAGVNMFFEEQSTVLGSRSIRERMESFLFFRDVLITLNNFLSLITIFLRGELLMIPVKQYKQAGGLIEVALSYISCQVRQSCRSTISIQGSVV